MRRPLQRLPFYTTIFSMTGTIKIAQNITLRDTLVVPPKTPNVILDSPKKKNAQSNPTCSQLAFARLPVGRPSFLPAQINSAPPANFSSPNAKNFKIFYTQQSPPHSFLFFKPAHSLLWILCNHFRKATFVL